MCFQKGCLEVDDITEIDDLLYAPEIEFKFIPSWKPGMHISVKIICENGMSNIKKSYCE